MFPLATPAELQAFLEEEALDLGAAGMDSLFGAGVLLLPASQPLVTTFAPTADPTGTDSLAVVGLALAARHVDDLPLGVRHHHGLRLANRASGARIAPRRPGGGVDADRPDAGHGLPLPAGRHQRLRDDVGADRTNRTAVPAAPLATTSASESVGSSQARLAGRVAANGTASTAWFEWGTTTAYGNVTSAQSVGALGETAVVAELTGLLATTQYHYRLIADNIYGQTAGADQVLTTTGGAPPFATTGAATALGTTGMTVNGDVTPGGLATTYQFDYRPVGFDGDADQNAAHAGERRLRDRRAGRQRRRRPTSTRASLTSTGSWRRTRSGRTWGNSGASRSRRRAPPAPPVTPPSSGGGGGGGSGSLNLGVTRRRREGNARSERDGRDPRDRHAQGRQPLGDTASCADRAPHRRDPPGCAGRRPRLGLHRHRAAQLLPRLPGAGRDDRRPFLDQRRRGGRQGDHRSAPAAPD